MADRVCRMMLRGLIDRIGGFEAATAVVEAATGAASKGTLSKMCAGQAGITLDVVQALENALGSYPITTRLFERIGGEPAEGGDLRLLAGRLAREAGCTVSDLLLAFSAASPDPSRLTGEERAVSICDLRRLRDVVAAALAVVEGDA